MLSDTVWNDAYTCAQLVAHQQGIALVDALLQQPEGRPDIHWRMEAQTSRADRLDVGESAMEEEGEIAFHLCTRVSS